MGSDINVKYCIYFYDNVVHFTRYQFNKQEEEDVFVYTFNFLYYYYDHQIKIIS